MAHILNFVSTYSTLKINIETPDQLERQNFYAIAKPLRELLPRLLKAKLITRMQPWPVPNLLPRSHNSNARCAYHMDLPEHHTSDYCPVKTKFSILLRRAYCSWRIQTKTLWTVSGWVGSPRGRSKEAIVI